GDLINETDGSYIANEVKMPELDFFERPNLRLHEIKASKRTIRFPRFITSTGSELRLIENQKKLLSLEENPKFILIKPILGILGTLENILCFKHQETGEIKILVPMHKADITGSLAPISSLSLINKENPKDPFDEVCTYAEYSYDKGRIIPKDIESKLFQSYLFLIQKKEKESLALLESIGNERSFSPKMIEILYLIKEIPHKTPSGIAIALRAGIFLSKVNKDSDVEDLFFQYRDLYTSIPAHLRLSTLELKEAERLCSTISLPKSHEITKTPIASSYQFLSTSVTATHNPQLMHFKDSKDFKKLYDELINAPTLEEKNIILARTNLDQFDKNRQALLLLAGKYQPSLFHIHPLNYVPYHYDPGMVSFLKQIIRLYSPLEAFLVPPSDRCINTDPPLPKGFPLKSLQSALDEVSVPSYTLEPLPERSAPPIL
ncbi:MAG: hypothetical protein JSS09_04115, partial [Verrucomicrobia bacterium]|nr:hypothetical protein [Verrucomicrobiota bacterium]